MPAATAKEYDEQIAAGNLVFLTEDNASRIQGGVPPDLWALKMQELELKRAAAMAPPFIPIQDAWCCGNCKCVNAGELASCADCCELKPDGERLVLAQTAALEQQKTNYVAVIENIRAQLKQADAEKEAKANGG